MLRDWIQLRASFLFPIYYDFFLHQFILCPSNFQSCHLLILHHTFARTFSTFNFELPFYKKFLFNILGSISNIEDDQSYRCSDGSSPEIQNKVISGVVAAASSVTSIQVANLLKLFKIPQVRYHHTKNFILFLIFFHLLDDINSWIFFLINFKYVSNVSTNYFHCNQFTNVIWITSYSQCF